MSTNPGGVSNADNSFSIDVKGGEKLKEGKKLKEEDPNTGGALTWEVMNREVKKCEHNHKKKTSRMHNFSGIFDMIIVN